MDTLRIENFMLEYEDDPTAVVVLDRLEEIIEDLNQEGADPRVADAIYDKLVEMLREARPGSPVLQALWDETVVDEDAPDVAHTEIMLDHPMHSIFTIKGYDDAPLTKFLDTLQTIDSEVCFSLKINGHGVRVVYDDGDLVFASTRARASAGRDITRQMRNILGARNEELVGEGVVDIRGEVCLRNDLLEEARKFNPKLKSAFSAVSSLIKPSSSVEENSLLTFLAFGAYTEGALRFSTREAMYLYLQSVGFEVPEYTTAGDINSAQDLEEILQAFEESEGNTDFFTDGVIAHVNEYSEYDELGHDGKYPRGSLALKLGYWEQSLYTGVVQGIIWTRGKSKLSPVALVAENEGDIPVFDGQANLSNLDPHIGVLTAQGNRVVRVPLYVPANILVLEAYPGRTLSLRYGGEAGVVPCFPDGTLLPESTAKAFVATIMEGE